MPKYTNLISVLLATAAVGRPFDGPLSIRWVPCSDVDVQSNLTSDCGTLSVPLDYSKPDDATVELQLFRVHAPQQPARGSIQLNFGGPGVPSGTTILTAGPKLLA